MYYLDICPQARNSEAELEALMSKGRWPKIYFGRGQYAKLLFFYFIFFFSNLIYFFFLRNWWGGCMALASFLSPSQEVSYVIESEINRKK
jgi:fatty acid desaturase